LFAACRRKNIPWISVISSVNTKAGKLANCLCVGLCMCVCVSLCLCVFKPYPLTS
jgi:hypothetical protein